MSVADFRRACRAYAARFVDQMRVDFKRLGVLGDWDEPYLTMNYGYQAAIVARPGPVRRARARLQGQEAGPLVHALPHRAGRGRGRVRGPHLAVDLRRVPAGAVGRRRSRGAHPGARRPRGLGPDLDDDALDHPVQPGRRLPSRLRLRRLRVRRPGRHPRLRAGRDGRQGHRQAARRSDRRGEGRGVRSAGVPAPALRSPVDRRARRLRHARGRHRRRPHRARPRLGRLRDRRPLRPGRLRPGRPGRPLHRRRAAVRRPAGVGRQPEGRGGAARARPPLAPRRVRPQLSALLALPQPGDLPGHVAVVHRHGSRIRGGRRPHPAGAVAGGDPGRAVDAGLGRGAHPQHARQPAGLVHLAPAVVGRADPGARLPGVPARAADAGAGRARRQRLRRPRRRRLVRAAARRVRARRHRLSVVRRHRLRARDQHPRRVVRLGLEPRGRARAGTRR